MCLRSFVLFALFYSIASGYILATLSLEGLMTDKAVTIQSGFLSLGNSTKIPSPLQFLDTVMVPQTFVELVSLRIINYFIMFLAHYSGTYFNEAFPWKLNVAGPFM